MPGLLERAKVLVFKKGGARGGPSPLGSQQSDESGISQAERSELVAQIEGIFTERRPIEITEKKKLGSGAKFPLFVNISAVAILAGGILATTQLSNVSSRNLGSKSANYLTTEGLVVQRVKQQAAEQVGASEARIAAIRRELEQLRSGPTANNANVTSAREKQLENELAALQSSTSNRLTTLQAQQQQQLFLVRQLQSIYQIVGTQIAGGKLDAALGGVASADNLLRDKAATAGGEIANIAPALEAGNAVLRSALVYGQSATKAMQAASTSDLSVKMATIEQLVRQGDDRYAAGDLPQAQIYYTRAVETLDSVSKAYGRLTAMSKAASGKQADQLAAQIEQLKGEVAKLRSTVDQQAAMIARQRSTIKTQEATIAEERRRAAGQEALLAAQTRQLETQKLALQKRTEELAAVVNAVQRSLQPLGGTLPGGAGQLGSTEMMKLLKTKVEIRSLAETKEARRAYPDLPGKIDGFFAKYAENYTNQGRESALNQVASALNDVIVSLNLKIQGNSIAPSSSPTGMLDQHQGLVSKADPIGTYLSAVDSTLARMAYPANGG